MSYTVTAWGSVDLTASPFAKAQFQHGTGPSIGRKMSNVAASVAGAPPQLVRQQPEPSTWELYVELDSDAESARKTLKETFVEGGDSEFMQMTDEAAGPWRCEMATEQIKRVDGANKRAHLITFWVPDPVWETNAEDSEESLNASGDSTTVTPTNDGDREAEPTLTIKYDTVKDQAVDDWRYSMRGFWANRSPKAYSNWPVMMLATSDTGGSWDAASHVKRTFAHAQINDIAGIDAVQTTIPYDTEVNSLDDEGMVYFDAGGGVTEQVSYTSKAGGNLTGCTRGIGGTTARAWADNFVFDWSQMLENADDFAVWLNGEIVERWVDSPNTATMKAWVNLTVPPRQTFTLPADITAGSPADGADLEVNEDISQMPPTGPVCIDDECIFYTGRDLANKKFTGIERGAWGSTAATHTTTDTIYRVDYLFTLGHGRPDYTGKALTSLARRPAIQLKASTPAIYYIGDESDDPLTTFLDPDNPGRSCMFQQDLEVPAADRNNAQPLLLDVSTTKAGWKDLDPVVGKPQVGRLSLALPVGIEATGSAITVDVQPRVTHRMRILGRDTRGVESSLADYWDVDEVALPAETLTPVDTLHELTFNAVRAVTSMAGPNLTTARGMDTDEEKLLTKFVVAQDMNMRDIVLYATAINSPNFEYTVRILDDSGSTPDAGGEIHKLEWNSGGSAFDETDFGGSLDYIAFAFKDDKAFFLPAGTYWLQIHITAYTSGDLGIAITDSPETPANEGYLVDPATANGAFDPTWMLFIHEEGGPVQPEGGKYNSGSSGDFDKLILKLNDAAADPWTPKMVRDADSTTALLAHSNAVISNDRNAKQITLDAWVPLGEELVVNCQTKQVTLTEGNLVVNMPHAVTPADEAVWITLAPGANVLTHTEKGMTSTDETATHRGRRL